MKIRILESSFLDLLEGKPKGYSPFRPGMTATVDIITNKRNQAINVPISAITIKTDTTSTKSPKKDLDAIEKNDQKMECVFVKNGDKAELRPVKTGIQDDSNIEIVSGLEEGEEVIIGPYNVVTKTLKDGDKVVIKSSPEGSNSNNN